MPLYALDKSGLIVAARRATPYQRYFCLECKGPLQKRNGKQRQDHFCHCHNSCACRLHQRSSDHLNLQVFLQKKYPFLQIEQPFASLLRIADLCWEQEKIIFEIQCSPIDPRQARKREADYAREGYKTIWLLDDRLYNRRRALRPGEEELIRCNGYYFNNSSKMIYDQATFIVNGIRRFRSAPMPVTLVDPGWVVSRSSLTRQLKQRIGQRYFSGDLYDRAVRYPSYLQSLLEHEKEALSREVSSRLAFVLQKYGWIGLEWLLQKNNPKIDEL
jgi:hypothetical protein